MKTMLKGSRAMFNQSWMPEAYKDFCGDLPTDCSICSQIGNIILRKYANWKYNTHWAMSVSDNIFSLMISSWIASK